MIINQSRVVLGDCVSGMRELEGNKFNLIIADPPYNLSKDFGVNRSAPGLIGSRQYFCVRDPSPPLLGPMHDV
jgi:DNA modification methylase